MRRSRRFRTSVAKAAEPAAAAPQPEPVPVQPLELNISFAVSGEIRKAVEAAAPDMLRDVVTDAIATGIRKLADRSSEASPGRVFKRVLLSKAEGAKEERYVLGVAMEPDEVDTQGDTQSAEDIRKAAFAFMEAYRGGGDTGHMGLMHKQIVDDQLAILESYIQKSDETINGEAVKAGSWMVGMRIIADELWKRVKDGDLTGFSIGGTAVKEKV